jgi:hypothetical protein
MEVIRAARASIIACCIAMLAPPAHAVRKPEAAQPTSAARSGASCGVEAVALRPSMGGSVLDFRYRVIDAKKALPIFDRKLKPYLLDATGTVALGVPEDQKQGSLRASTRNPPVAGKQYYVFFANSHGSVNRGERVSVVLGPCRIDGVTVD